jgi:hypothetical protein
MRIFCEVRYVTKDFNLADAKSAFDFIFQIYNFVSAAKADNDSFLDTPELELQNIKELVLRKKYPTLASKKNCEAAETSTNRSPPGGIQDSFDNPSIQEGLMAAGYTLTQTMSDELVPITPVSHNSCRCAILLA